MLWGLGSSLGAGSEGGLGTPLPVEHLEEELNTKLLGHCAGTVPPSPARTAVLSGPAWTTGVESCFGSTGATLRLRGWPGVGISGSGGLKAYVKDLGKQ